MVSSSGGMIASACCSTSMRRIGVEKKDYSHDVFGRGDFDHLAAQPAGIKDKFPLSINDARACAQLSPPLHGRGRHDVHGRR